jgi:hypothetical protein
MGITEIEGAIHDGEPGHGCRRGQVGEVEALRQRIDELVCERQRLRTDGANRASLERNRIRLAGSQSELSRAVIAWHPAT